LNAAPRIPDDFVPFILYDGNAEVRGRGRGRRKSQFPTIAEQSDQCMLEILIVENDAQLGTMLKDMIEIEPVFRVTNIAGDLAGTLAAIEVHRPEIALIDIHLGGYATGIEVAARMLEIGIPTLFSTANPLPFPVPELALGCLCKPYTCYSVAQSLRIARQLIRGEQVDPDIPLELELY
jgi:two-component system, response regulator PdtaR